MNRLLASAILVLALAMFPARASELDLGSLRIHWLDGFTQVGTGSPVHLAGPNGVDVLVTVWSVTPGSKAEPENDSPAVFVNIAESRLPELAAAQGKVVLPLQREVLKNGSVLYSTASQSGPRRKPSFYLQYMLIAPSKRAALFTVEGPGEALVQHPLFSGRFASAMWADDR